MFMYKSSIGKKFVQAITGAFLILFLLLHGTINFLSVIDSFTGSFGAPNGLFQKGCDFMGLPIVTILVPVLALGFVIHILYGFWLEYTNIKSRGASNAICRQQRRNRQWSSKNMVILAS